MYSNCGEVELSLNGRSLGSKPLPGNAAARVWRVPFEAGTLRAVCGGASYEMRTAGKAARITLRVGSALTDVGLTALFSGTLADAGISCNVIAGLAHDHLFVGWDQAARALALLREL